MCSLLGRLAPVAGGHGGDGEGTKVFVLPDFMAMLSDPGAFTKGAEKRDEAMKGLGIEQTDAKAEAKKKEEEERKKRGILGVRTRVRAPSYFFFPGPNYLILTRRHFSLADPTRLIPCPRHWLLFSKPGSYELRTLDPFFCSFFFVFCFLFFVFFFFFFLQPQFLRSRSTD
jgi:hypothetical protein